MMNKMKHNKEIEKIKNDKLNNKKSSKKSIPRLSFGDNEFLSNTNSTKNKSYEKNYKEEKITKGNFILFTYYFYSIFL